MIIAINFDGTCVTHDYPDVGQDVGAASVIKRFVERGDKIILFTMRSKNTLQAACDWFHDNDIPLFGINQNPEQHTWSSSPKPYAHVYIDDAALGAPLRRIEGHSRPVVDWVEVAVLMGVVK